MIQLNNLAYLRIDFGSMQDAVGHETPVALKIEEDLGNYIPSAVLEVGATQQHRNYLTNGSASVDIFVGTSEENAIKSSWRVSDLNEIASGVRLTLNTNLDYTEVSKINAFKNMDSVSAIKEVVKNYFCMENADGNSTVEVSDYEDKMTWLQCQQTDRRFVDDVWLHSYKAGSLMVPGITANILGKGEDRFGTFRLIDLYNRKKIIEFSENDKGVIIIEDTKIPFCDKPSKFKLNRSTDVNNDNVHKHYYEASKLNLSVLNKLARVYKILRIEGRYKLPIMIGDFIRIPSRLQGERASWKVQSGDYIVSKTITELIYTKDTLTFTKTMAINGRILDLTEYEQE